MSKRIFNGNLDDKLPDDQILHAIEWLAEQMPGGFFIYRADDSQELLYLNHSVCELFGCDSVEELRAYTNNSFRGMVHPEDFEYIQSSIDEQIADKQNDDNMDYVVYRIIRKDGSIRWVDDYGRFTYLPGFGDVYYVFIGDITQTRMADEERERNKYLSKALKKAEQANLAKTAFLSNMSHEIRTPITAILGMNEMIRRETDNEAILEYSENIRKAGESLLRIISDILDFSKIEAGQMELVEEDYAMGYLIRDLYNLISLRAEAKGLLLQFDISPNIPQVLKGDEIRVKQVISNLLTNAVKYTERGIVTLKIEKIEEADAFATLRISVKDTRIGIKESEMGSLFESFHRLDSKRTRNIEGSGLGLAICSQMLQMMGSELEVKSVYESGSTFWFDLRQQVTDAAPIGPIDLRISDKERKDKAAKEKKTTFVAPGISILVVDDTPMNLQVIAGLLKRTKMQIDTASSGYDCIDKFEGNDYDLVFLDFRMPQLNGIETLHKLKELYPDKCKSIPIISLTASAVKGDRERLLEAGFTDYLAKPINIEEMEEMLMKYLPDDAVIRQEEEDGDKELLQLPKKLLMIPGLNVKKGLEYCGDAEDYLFAIETYSSSVADKSNQIENAMKNDDTDQYVLLTHSLKSTSKAIGAELLFSMARDLEAAGKENNINEIKKGTASLLEAYRALGDRLKEVIEEE